MTHVLFDAPFCTLCGGVAAYELGSTGVLFCKSCRQRYGATIQREARKRGFIGGADVYAVVQSCAAKCECGADTCNTTHSTWCPRYAP